MAGVLQQFGCLSFQHSHTGAKGSEALVCGLAMIIAVVDLLENDRQTKHPVDFVEQEIVALQAGFIYQLYCRLRLGRMTDNRFA